MFREKIPLLSGNKLIETLNEENDMFGTIEKAENLISIFRDMRNYINDIKMIGIYGEWGSGKTTYMNYVCNRLNEIKVNDSRIYKAISFEAWKYEFDDSLHLSLMECLSSYSTTIQKDILKDCFLFLKNIALNSKVSLKLPLDMFSLDIDAGKSLEDTISQGMPVSLYGKLVEFREVYKSLVSEILKENKFERLVVCVDDLDRCEPENVINLLSMIKHFFTYDERVKFICMLDKDAVSKAFLTKYGDVVKSKEYLEKIFDLNFTLNDSEDTSKLIKHYITTEEDAKLVEEFFKKMGIFNPRRIIKILNRSLFLERFLFKTDKHKAVFINTDSNSECINYSFKENSFFYSLLLYFVIYKEYYLDEFNKIFNFEEKLENLKNTRKLVKHSSGSDIYLNEGYFQFIIKNDINKFIIRNRGFEVEYEGIEGFGDWRSMINSNLNPFFYIFIPFFKEHSISYIDSNKELLIMTSRGIDGDYPYNFMNIYYNESYKDGNYNSQVEEKFFAVKPNTEINIYKLYKFVKDN